jgi:hypothetical protein
VRILGGAVQPQVPQSDNGTEFLGRCICIVRKHFNTIQIVMGRPYHPQSKGSIERGNAPFKEALLKWIAENPGVGLATVGIHVVNQAINGWPSRSKGKLSPYQIYYGTPL